MQDLINESHRSRKHIPEEQVAQLIKGILLGLRAIHKANYVHRDVKPSNICIVDEPKLIDFGLAVRYQARQGIDDSCGTLAYQAPE